MSTEVNTALRDEFQYYLDHQEDFASKYDGMIIVLKGHKVIGSYRTQLEALSEAKKSHALGTFLVQQVSRGSSATSHTFHSRVAFH